MYRVIECLTQDHNYALVALAALVCVLGACLSAKLMRRMLVAKGKRKTLRLIFSGMIGATTIWSTHFVAMLAYDPGYPHGFDPLITVLSLVVAMVGQTGAMAILGYLRPPWNYVIGGPAYGASVASMHYVGMAAYKVPGHLVWDAKIVAASLLLGAVFGVAAFQRITHPFGRRCWLGAGVLLVLAICGMHFTAMTGFHLEFVPQLVPPEEVIPDYALGFGIFGVTAVLFFIGFMGMSIEMHIEREARGKIETTAFHDALTGLPNRLYCAKKIRSYGTLLGQDRRQRVAVITIDLTRFKEVNSLHGHQAGDAVLIEIARRLTAACENEEFVARLGGDEFVAIKLGFRRVDEVKAFAERLHARIIEPLNFADRRLSVGAAVGVATSIRDGRDLDELLQKSELARARAKSTPGCDVCLFSAEMQKQNHDRIMMIEDLSLAAARGEFKLVYQMQNAVDTRAPVGFEALLRWDHATRGPISPAEFIPLAEETGLIRDIGIWVLRQACTDAASWDQPLRIAVNVAPQQLAQPSFLEHLSDVLIETRLPPERLELEVTEASIIDDQEHTLKVMRKIKAMGVCIAMDDFGTGYSSLATLRAFPYDKIKVDRSFIRDVHLDKQRDAIVRSILLLGNALGIPVLAEGVEVEAELAFLREEKCQYVQGFLFGRPVSADQIGPLLKNGGRVSA